MNSLSISNVEQVQIMDCHINDRLQKCMRLPAKEGFEITWLNITDMEKTYILDDITSKIFEKLLEIYDEDS